MKVLSWIKAARPASQSYIALPILMGQVVAWSLTGSWSWTAFVLAQLFGVFDQMYIVFANDVADFENDKLNETYTPFSGGSRVLVDGAIERRTLAKAAIFCACVCLAIAIIFAIVGSYVSAALIPVGLALLWAYSYPPFKLSYRGGGEFLQMLGVGLVLPLVGFFAQTTVDTPFPWALLLWFLPLQLACGITTTVPDAPSDKLGAKETIAVALGERTAMLLVCALNFMGVAIFAYTYLSVSVLLVPAAALALCLAASFKAKPGNNAMLAFAFFSILTNLSVTIGFTITTFYQ